MVAVREAADSDAEAIHETCAAALTMDAVAAPALVDVLWVAEVNRRGVEVDVGIYPLPLVAPAGLEFAVLGHSTPWVAVNAGRPPGPRLSSPPPPFRSRRSPPPIPSASTVPGSTRCGSGRSSGR